MSERTTAMADYIGCLLGIALLGLMLYLCLLLGELLAKRAGRNGLGALNRLLGAY